MNILHRPLDRRTVLRGLGATIALPFLDVMSPVRLSAAAATPPMRMAFVYVPNGIIHKSWLPQSEGKGFEMMPTMKALEPFREELIVLSNLSHAQARSLGDGGGDHARAGATFLTGIHCKKTDGADIRAGISADQIAALELGKHTQFGSLELGIDEPYFAGGCDSGYSCAYTNTLSWRGPSTPNPMEISPRAVFERLFGSAATNDPAVRRRQMQEDRSILDFVLEDLPRLARGMGTRDKRKLDEYLVAIRDIERRIQKAEEQSATMGVPVMGRPQGIPDLFDDHTKLMSDLMVIAFQTDMTRMITFMMQREGSNRAFPEIGVPEGCHIPTHHQDDPEKIAKAQKIDEFRVRSLVYLVQRMKETTEGDGTLLDHTLLLYGAGIRDGNSHSHDDLPLVLFGGKAAGLKGGRHLRSAVDTPMTNLLLTMLDKVGVPLDHLGDSTGKLDLLAGL
jgi:hypothetical protein